MHKRLTFHIHKLKYDKCMSFYKDYNGKLSTVQPERNPESDFIEVEMYFDDVNKMHKFIYKCFMLFGVYFYIDELINKQIVF